MITMTILLLYIFALNVIVTTSIVAYSQFEEYEISDRNCIISILYLLLASTTHIAISEIVRWVKWISKTRNEAI